MNDHFHDFALPDTALTRRAHAFITRLCDPVLVGHSVRAYLFGRELGTQAGLRPDEHYDDEVLFLACLLHDAGLSPEGDRAGRFEADGADTAVEFLAAEGLDERRRDIIWQAIALHTSAGIADRMRPEIALTHIGTGADIAALRARSLPEDLAARAHATWPRSDIGPHLTQAIVEQIRRNPAKASLFSLPFELLRQTHPDTPVPGWLDTVTAAWPGVP
ncbi:HD domain-containing protein [Actinocorallia populi]|uniref:HD domain-containing protein n=1 Tax=Actinocorallia populi TaxID=2079200 RepID=UPI000D093AEE|nr:HD domain-containing protein [Actinocorallia populi]